jgi:Ca2+-binding EF-hand superfamily protein
MGQGVKQANRVAHRASTLATAAARTAVKTAVKTKEARKQEKDDAKLTKEALLMAKHAARINTKHKFGASVLIDQLKTPENTWMNENTEKINQVVREHLPGKSIKVVRRCIDSLRLISNFYVAIYICTFIAESHIAEKMTTLTRAGNLVGLVTVIIANTLLDPLVTFEYATIRTMGVVNPLLVGETLEKVADIDRLKQQVALKILVHWRNVADPSFDEATYVPTKEHLHKLVKRAFDDWDEDKGGSLDEREFKAALERAGIFFSNAQVNRLFRAIDCFQYNGSIDCEEFWATLGPVLVKTLEEIQGTATFEPFTNNIDDTLVSLEDLQVATKRRRMLRLAKAEAKAEEDALLVDIYEEGDPEGKFMSLLAHATKGKLTKEQALMGAKFLRTLKNPPDAKQAPGVRL